MDPKQWTRFAHFFADHGVIKALPRTGDVLTQRLPAGKGPVAASASRSGRERSGRPAATVRWWAASTKEPARPRNGA